VVSLLWQFALIFVSRPKYRAARHWHKQGGVGFFDLRYPVDITRGVLLTSILYVFGHHRPRWLFTLVLVEHSASCHSDRRLGKCARLTVTAHVPYGRRTGSTRPKLLPLETLPYYEISIAARLQCKYVV
jgi:hypothetical protein